MRRLARRMGGEAERIGAAIQVIVVSAMRAGTFRVRIKVDANVERAETTRLFIAFTDRLELGLKVEVLDVGEIAASEAVDARDTSGTVGEAFAHAWTGWHSEVSVVVELRIDGAGVGQVKVATISACGAGGVRSSGRVRRESGRDMAIREPGTGTGNGAGSGRWIGRA